MENQTEANAAVERLGAELLDHIVVEDPGRPLAEGAVVKGEARIVEEIPEHVVVQTEAAMPAYLVLADTYDPGWSATVDGQLRPIWPAYIAFRAVYLTPGPHTVIFRYRPAGFELGLVLTVCGVIVSLIVWFLPRPAGPARAGTCDAGLAFRMAEMVVLGARRARARFGGGHHP